MDIIEKRSQKDATVRDNVILECGLFIGHYGRKRCFIIQPRDIEFETPSDLMGLQPATYDPERANLHAALRPCCEEIVRSLKKHISIEYPEEGDYGPNLLNENIKEPLKASSQNTLHYSLAAVSPTKLPLKVRLTGQINDDNKNGKRSGWWFTGGSENGWVKSELLDKMTREFRLPRGGRGDLDVHFKGSGTLQVEIFEGEENTLTESYKLDWEQVDS